MALRAQRLAADVGQCRTAAQRLERVGGVHRDRKAGVVERGPQRGYRSASRRCIVGVAIAGDRPQAARCGAPNRLARVIQRVDQQRDRRLGRVARKGIGRLDAILHAHVARLEDAGAGTHEGFVRRRHGHRVSDGPGGEGEAQTHRASIGECTGSVDAA
jgi:hypothetical protein